MAKTPAIQQGSLVTLHFALALQDGSVVDDNFAGEPASFKIGDGNMLPGFEAQLNGLRAGEEIEKVLAPE